MKQLVTKGIVLNRTNYGEADRILTILTPDQGKIRVMARGVRRIKSKLAGGVELFSVSNITFIRGRGEIGTLISARLLNHYGQIVNSLDRVQQGYELLKTFNRVTEDNPEKVYFDILTQALIALDDINVESGFINCWVKAQLLKCGGHSPNLATDTEGSKLILDQSYNFDIEAMTFSKSPNGTFRADHIKALRLLFSSNPPNLINNVTDMEQLLADVSQLVEMMCKSHIGNYLAIAK